MRKEPNSEIFENPVDPINTHYTIKDYHEIIKTPMDFSTIKSKLFGNSYIDCNEFVDDVK